jgi:hypothetical protein
MAVTLDGLTRLSQTELDDLFRASPMGDMPDGDAEGIAIVALEGPAVEGPILWFARWLAWRGKVVDRPRQTLLNKVGPFSWHLIRASMYVAPSWFDTQPAIILDYSKTSLIARSVRDEIREVGPGTYLGIVYIGTTKTVNFALQFPNAGAPVSA